MLIEDDTTRSALDSIVRHLTSNRSLREDFHQEALIHLWRLENRIPGQTVSWYLQNCRFHLQHLLASGKSVDALKRSSGRCRPGGRSAREQRRRGNSWHSREDVFAEVGGQEVTSM